MSKPCLILHNWVEGKQSSTSMAAGEDKFLALQFTSWLAWLQHQSASHTAKWTWSEQTACHYFATEADTLSVEITEKCPTTHFFPGQMECLAVRGPWQEPSAKTHCSPHMINSGNSKESLNLHRQNKCRAYHISPGHLNVLLFNFFLKKRTAMTQGKSFSSSVRCI